MLGFIIILTFLVMGEALSVLIGHFMPGSVLGMVLLFLALCLKIVKADRIRGAAEFLTGNMTVLFIPSAIGIMEQWGLIRNHMLPWIVIVVGCWALVLASAGWTHQLVSAAGKSIGRQAKGDVNMLPGEADNGKPENMTGESGTTVNEKSRKQ